MLICRSGHIDDHNILHTTEFIQIKVAKKSSGCFLMVQESTKVNTLGRVKPYIDVQKVRAPLAGVLVVL